MNWAAYTGSLLKHLRTQPVDHRIIVQPLCKEKVTYLGDHREHRKGRLRPVPGGSRGKGHPSPSGAGALKNRRPGPPGKMRKGPRLKIPIGEPAMKDTRHSLPRIARAINHAAERLRPPGQGDPGPGTGSPVTNPRVLEQPPGSPAGAP